MLQPREGTGRAGRGPGRGGKPRELPIRSRDAVAASPHRTAAAAAGMGNPRPPLSAGTPRAPPAANARGCGAESAGSPESRGASRIPGGSRIRRGGGGGASCIPQTEEPRARCPTGSSRHSPGHRAAPGARSRLASPGSRTSPAPAPGNSAATRTHPGTDHRRSGQPRPAEPAPLRHPGSAGEKLRRARTYRALRWSAVRCGTGAGRARALRQHRPLRARVQQLCVAPPTTRKPRPLPASPAPPQPAPPPPIAPPTAVYSARGPRSDRRGSRWEPHSPPELRLCRAQPGAPPAAPGGHGGQKGWGHLGSGRCSRTGWWCAYSG